MGPQGAEGEAEEVAHRFTAPPGPPRGRGGWRGAPAGRRRRAPTATDSEKAATTAQGGGVAGRAGKIATRSRDRGPADREAEQAAGAWR